MIEFEDIARAVIEGNSEEAEKLTRQAVEEGVSPLEIFRHGLIAGMDVVGQKMKAGEYYLPEVLISAEAMKAASDIVKPIIVQQGANETVGKVVVGTVKGDLHDIGKRVVTMMLEGAAFEVIDIGIDVPAERFVQAVGETKPQIVGMSALLTSTMLEMRGVISSLAEAGLRDTVKVVIGGAPVTQRFCDEIGADGYAPDAATGVELARGLLGMSKA